MRRKVTPFILSCLINLLFSAWFYVNRRHRDNANKFIINSYLAKVAVYTTIRPCPG